MSSLAVGCRLGLELWLGGVFSAAELAAAELLLQLGGDDDEAPSTMYSSGLLVSSSSKADLTAEEWVVQEAASLELDRRARKRYRRVSDLYTATTPVMDAPPSKKGRTCDGGGGDEVRRLYRESSITH